LETGHTVRPRPRFLQRLHRRLGCQIAQKAHDELRPHAEVRGGEFLRAPDATNHGVEGNSATRVCLRIEKHFRVDHVLAVGLQQVLPGQLEKIFFVPEHGHGAVIDREKRRQVVKVVGREQRFGRVVVEHDAVLFGQGQAQLRLQRAFQVDVQLGLGQVLDESFHGGTGAWRVRKGGASPGPPSRI
jgi:hypothetical protein